MAWTRCWWPSQDIVAGTARTALVGGALIFPITVLLLLGADNHFPRAWNKWSESGRKPRSGGNAAPSCDVPFPWERAWNGPTAYPPGDHGAVQGPGRPWTQEYELRRQTRSQELGTPCGELPSALSGDCPGGWPPQWGTRDQQLVLGWLTHLEEARTGLPESRPSMPHCSIRFLPRWSETPGALIKSKQALWSLLTTDWVIKHSLELFFKGHVGLTTGILRLPHRRGPGERLVWEKGNYVSNLGAVCRKTWGLELEGQGALGEKTLAGIRIPSKVSWRW